MNEVLKLGNEIRAVFDKKTIRVYQAYNDKIANELLQLNTFGPSFSMNRMTWIKPSFLWMMFDLDGELKKIKQEYLLLIYLLTLLMNY